MILAGDIGGTKTQLALYHYDGQTGLVPIAKANYPSRAYPTLEEIVTAFLQGRNDEIESACLGIAGPVRGHRVEATNLHWVIDGLSLAPKIGVPRVHLINDLEANAWGIAALRDADFVTVNKGIAGAKGICGVIAAGTGLGEAGLYWDGRRHRPFASEGGHVDFAPQDELQEDLLRWLRREFNGHVSYERILSGPGLFNVYRFLRDSGRGHESAALADEMASADPAAAVSRHALAGDSDLCVAALDLFVEIYGAEAGNLALKLLAHGGLYVGGGIAPKILPKLIDGRFRASYLRKGRLSGVLEQIPLRIITCEETPLMGAALCAMVGSAER